MKKIKTSRKVIICIAFLLIGATVFSQNNSTNKSSEIYGYKTITEYNVNDHNDYAIALNKLLITLKSEFEKISSGTAESNNLRDDIKLIANLISWVNMGNDISGFPEKNQEGIINLKSIPTPDDANLQTEASFLGEKIIEFPGLIIKRQQKQ